MRRCTLVTVIVGAWILLMTARLRGQELRIVDVRLPRETCVRGPAPLLESCDSGELAHAEECVEVPPLGCLDAIDRAEASGSTTGARARSLILQGTLGEDGSEVRSPSSIVFDARVHSGGIDAEGGAGAEELEGSYAGDSEMLATIRVVPSFPGQAGAVALDWSLGYDIRSRTTGAGSAAAWGLLTMCHVGGPGGPVDLPAVDFFSSLGDEFADEASGTFLVEIGQVFDVLFKGAANSVHRSLTRSGRWRFSWVHTSSSCDDVRIGGEGLAVGELSIDEEGSATFMAGAVMYTGSFDGEVLSMSAEQREDGGTTRTRVRLELGDDGTSFSGTSNWTWSDGQDSCSGVDSMRGERVDTEADAGEALSAVRLDLRLRARPRLEFTISGSPGDAVQPPPDAQLVLRADDGAVVDSWRAFSGADFLARPGDVDCSLLLRGESSLNNPHFAAIPSVGPIPPGRYLVRPRGSNDWRPEWYPVEPLSGTATHGRRGFYIHGLDRPETQGCIGVAPGSYGEFRDVIDREPGVFELVVSYDDFADADLRFPPEALLETCLGQVTYRLASPVDLHLETGQSGPDSYVTGFDPGSERRVQDIDGSFYSGPDSEPEILTRVYLPGRENDDRLTLFPEGDGGAYTLDVTIAAPGEPEVTARRQSTLGRGEVTELVVELRDDRVTLREVAGDSGFQIPSDCNQDGRLDLSDGICLLGHLFQGSPAVLPCGDGTSGAPGNRTLLDANADARLDISDGVHVFAYLFLGGAPPALGERCVAIASCPTVCGE